MKICVFGAGAIGGLIAGRLAGSGHEVSVVARGAHLAAIRQRGLVLRSGGQETTHHLVATSDARSLGVQDVVIVAVKTWALSAAAGDIASLVGPQTTVVPAMNGVPWWFFDGFEGAGGTSVALAGMKLDALDPGGHIAASLPSSCVLGCVVYPAAHVPEPGVVVHTGREEIVLGEPFRASSSVPGRAPELTGRRPAARRQPASQREIGSRIPRTEGSSLMQVLNEARFTCTVTPDIRREIWRKLIGNASFNAVSALTCATLDKMLAEPAVYRLLETLMAEVIAVGNALGLAIHDSPQERIERGWAMGAVKFSMLQDLEQGRPFEFESLTGAVATIAGRLGVPVPTLDTVDALIRLRSKTMTSVSSPTRAEP